MSKNRGSVLIECLMSVFVLAIIVSCTVTLTKLKYYTYSYEPDDMDELWDDDERCSLYCAEKWKDKDFLIGIGSGEQVELLPVVDLPSPTPLLP